jgi:Flp pilus assembly protein TadD
MMGPHGMAAMISKRILLVLLAVGLVVLAGCAARTTGEPSPTALAPPTTILPSGDVTGHLEAGEAALNQADLVTAEREYRSAASLDPNSAQAQFGLGNVYVRQGRFAEAERAYKAALSLDPAMSAAQTNLGVAYYQLGQLSRAADALALALEMEPNDAKTIYLMAVIRLQENKLPEAEQLLVKAKEIDPNLPEVYYGFGVLYRLKGQNQDAIDAFERFLAVGPGQDPASIEHAQQELEALKGK